MKKSIPIFRIISLVEGLSLLVLLCIAMPLKYLWAMPQMVQVVGLAHGVFFIAYVLVACFLGIRLKWRLGKLLIILAASIIPFGTFYIDAKYFKHQVNQK
jgi:integral membrane protein